MTGAPLQVKAEGSACSPPWRPPSLWFDRHSASVDDLSRGVVVLPTEQQSLTNDCMGFLVGSLPGQPAIEPMAKQDVAKASSQAENIKA